jgi:peptide subunit release factor RF-3
MGTPRPSRAVAISEPPQRARPLPDTNKHTRTISLSAEVTGQRSARRVSCADPKKLAAFQKASQANLALDAEGNLAYLAPSEWRLGFVASSGRR